MKQILLVFLIWQLPAHAMAQVVSIMTQESNLYLCMDNRLTVAVEGVKSNEILLSTNNGEIEQDNYGPGRYRMRAKSVGRATVYVKRKTKNGTKIIDSLQFRVKRRTLGMPNFEGMHSGAIKQFLALNGIAIVVSVECCEVHAYALVKGFTTVVKRNGQEVFRRKSVGCTIDSITKDFFYELRNSDQLIFTDITVKDCDDAILPMEPIQLTITDAYEYENVAGKDSVDVIDPITGEIYRDYREVTKMRKRK